MISSSLIKFYILKYGTIGIFISCMLEYLAVPIPSEIVLPFIGAVAKSNNQNIFLLTFVAVLGGTTGSLIMFLLGKYIIKDFIDKLKDKYPNLRESLNHSEKYLFKYRYFGVFISRTIPMARSLTSIVAGTIEMKLSRFLFFSALGMTIWDFTLIKIGTIYTQNENLINQILKKYALFFIALISIIILIYIIIKVIKHRRKLHK